MKESDRKGDSESILASSLADDTARLLGGRLDVEQKCWSCYPTTKSTTNRQFKAQYIRISRACELADFIVPGASELLLRKTVGPKNTFQ